jgi:hypothetical protein
MDVPVGPDGPAHPNLACYDCKGTATKLRPHPLVMSYRCLDSELCHKTQLLEALLASTRSG